MTDAMQTRAMLIKSFQAASRMGRVSGIIPMTAATHAGMLLETCATTRAAIEMCETALRYLRQVEDAESAPTQPPASLVAGVGR